MQTAIVQSGCHSGTNCLEASESPLQGTPYLLLAWISHLHEGDLVKGTFWAKGGPTSSVRIWGHWTEETSDYNSFDASAGGNELNGGAGNVWTKLSYSWTVPEDGLALMIRANMYCESEDDVYPLPP